MNGGVSDRHLEHRQELKEKRMMRLTRHIARGVDSVSLEEGRRGRWRGDT